MELTIEGPGWALPIVNRHQSFPGVNSLTDFLTDKNPAAMVFRLTKTKIVVNEKIKLLVNENYKKAVLSQR